MVSKVCKLSHKNVWQFCLLLFTKLKLCSSTMYMFRATKKVEVSAVKSKPKALWHFKVDPVLKIEETFHCRLDRCMSLMSYPFWLYNPARWLFLSEPLQPAWNILNPILVWFFSKIDLLGPCTLAHGIKFVFTKCSIWRLEK